MPTTTISRCGGTTTSSYADAINTLRITNQLVALWKLDEGATPWLDTSGYLPTDPADMDRQVRAVPMTQNYTPALVAGTTDAYSVAFNADGYGGGVGDFLQANGTDASRFDFTGTASYSVVAWVKPFSATQGSLGGVLAQINLHAWAPPAGTTRGWQLGVNHTAQTPYFLRYPDTAYGAAGVVATAGAISNNAVHMIAGTYDGANLKIYVDGALGATTATVAPLPVNGNWPYLGLGQDTTATTSEFYGAVAEVSVWGAALSAGDIATLYAAGT